MFQNSPEWFDAVAWGAFLISLVFVAVWGMAVLVKVHEGLSKRLAVLDRSPAMLTFGKSWPGRTIHNALAELLPQVDEASDPFIRRAMTLPLLKQLHEWDLLTPEQFSDLASRALADGIRLTNGVPDVEFKIIPPASG